MPTKLDGIEREVQDNLHMARVTAADILALVAVARAAIQVCNEMALSPQRRPKFHSYSALVAALAPLEKTGIAAGDCLGPGCVHEWEQMDGTYDGWFCGHCGAERDDDPRAGSGEGDSR